MGYQNVKNSITKKDCLFRKWKNSTNNIIEKTFENET